jgi:ABC-2 type transport system ATP-binding protein
MYLYCCGTLYLDQAKEEYVMEYLLSTDCLTKKFKRQTAIDNISLHIRQGEIYGLIGKNVPRYILKV